MSILFYSAGAIAVAATILAITRANPVHALLYLIVSLLAVALAMLALGAPFAAALEVLVYAGAIMVLFLFVVMLMNIGPETEDRERQWIEPAAWLGPGLIALVLLIEVCWMILVVPEHPAGATVVEAKTVGISLFGPYLLAVELGSFLLLAGLISAYHLGRPSS